MSALTGAVAALPGRRRRFLGLGRSAGRLPLAIDVDRLLLGLDRSRRHRALELVVAAQLIELLLRRLEPSERTQAALVAEPILWREARGHASLDRLEDRHRFLTTPGLRERAPSAALGVDRIVGVPRLGARRTQRDLVPVISAFVIVCSGDISLRDDRCRHRGLRLWRLVWLRGRGLRFRRRSLWARASLFVRSLVLRPLVLELVAIVLLPGHGVVGSRRRIGPRALVVRRRFARLGRRRCNGRKLLRIRRRRGASAGRTCVPRRITARARARAPSVVRVAVSRARGRLHFRPLVLGARAATANRAAFEEIVERVLLGAAILRDETPHVPAPIPIVEPSAFFDLGPLHQRRLRRDRFGGRFVPVRVHRRELFAWRRFGRHDGHGRRRRGWRRWRGRRGWRRWRGRRRGYRRRVVGHDRVRRRKQLAARPLDTHRATNDEDPGRRGVRGMPEHPTHER